MEITSGAYLEEVVPSGKAADFVVSNDSGPTQLWQSDCNQSFFVAVRGKFPYGEEQLSEGDLLAVSCEMDAEPGDLVVWWTGSLESQALARVQQDLSLRSVAGFPNVPVVRERGQCLQIRGVVVGRLRRLAM